MKVLLLTICLSLSQLYSRSQSLNSKQKDSLIKVICKMEEIDQAIRKPPVKDTISSAVFEATELANFKLLADIIDHIGFPDAKLLGKTRCHVYGIMIHWAKEYPEWFNNKKTVTIFKREIDKGNMALFVVDNAQFFYVSYMKAGLDMTYWKLINEARSAYGLPTYNKAQFQKKEWIEPLKGNEKHTVIERLSNY